MASKEKEAPAAKKGGKGNLIVLVGLSVVAMGAGAATPWILKAGGTSDSESASHASAAPSQGSAHPPSGGHPAKSSSGGHPTKSSSGHPTPGGHGDVSSVIPLCEATAGLLEPNRYLRVKLMVAVDDKDSHEVSELLNKKKAHLKSWLISYMSDLSVKDVARSAGVNRMKREIRDQFNVMLFPNGHEKIVEVLFDEYVMQ